MNRRDFLLTTGSVAGFALLHAGLRSAEAASVGNRMKGRPFVFNQDCNAGNFIAPPGQAQAWCRDKLARTFAAGAGVFVADVALPEVVVAKDIPTAEVFGARFPKERRKDFGGCATMEEGIGICFSRHRVDCTGRKW